MAGDGYTGRMEETGYDEEEEGSMGAGAGPTATVRPHVVARALVLDEDYGDEETYGVIEIPSDDEIIILSD